MPKPLITKGEEIFSLDLRTLALFRILLGMYIVIDAFAKFALVPAFYSDNGIIPREIVNLANMEFAYYFQLMMLSGSEWYAYFYLSVMVLLGTFLILGYKTRLITFFCWILFTSLIIRGNVINNAGDTLTVLFLFWSIFLPLGHAFSVDSYLNGYKNKSKSVFSAATIAMYVQFLLMYITTGIFKSNYLSWLDGTHLYLTFSRFEYMTSLSFWVYPNYELLSFLTTFSLYLELFGPLLFILPFFFFFSRMMGIVLFIGLQISIALTMKVGPFPLASVAGILVFLPTQFWESNVLRSIQDQISAFKLWLKNKLTFQIHTRSDGIDPLKKHHPITEIFLCLAIMYVVMWNMGEVSKSFALPEVLKKPGYYMKLNQRWSMFSSTVHNGEYFSVYAHYNDGTTVDLMMDLKTEHNSSESFHHITFNSSRWRKLFSSRIQFEKHAMYRPYLTNYLLRTYGELETEDRKLLKVELVGYRHFIGDYYNHSEVVPRVLYSEDFDFITASGIIEK